VFIKGPSTVSQKYITTKRALLVPLNILLKGLTKGTASSLRFNKESSSKFNQQFINRKKLGEIYSEFSIRSEHYFCLVSKFIRSLTFNPQLCVVRKKGVPGIRQLYFLQPRISEDLFFGGGVAYFRGVPWGSLRTIPVGMYSRAALEGISAKWQRQSARAWILCLRTSELYYNNSIIEYFFCDETTRLRGVYL
jgi:hypothetical protein